VHEGPECSSDLLTRHVRVFKHATVELVTLNKAIFRQDFRVQLAGLYTWDNLRIDDSLGDCLKFCLFRLMRCEAFE